jgi:hypothetical protein
MVHKKVEKHKNHPEYRPAVFPQGAEQHKGQLEQYKKTDAYRKHVDQVSQYSFSQGSKLILDGNVLRSSDVDGSGQWYIILA